MRFHVCSWNGVVGTVDVDLRSLEGYFVRMKVGESSEIWASEVFQRSIRVIKLSML